VKTQSKKTRALTLGEKAELALKAAVRKVAEENARLGLPLYVGQGGEVLEVWPAGRARNSPMRSRKRRP